jgi:cell division protein FtsW (lipid II flippase)
VLLGLSTISLTAIYGALPLINSYTISYDILYKQVIWIIIAIVLLVLLLVFGVDVLFSAIDYAYWILIGFLVLLLLDKVINLPFIYPINGTRAWITIPGLGTIQPSEFMKAVLIIKSSIVITNEREKRQS